MKTKLAALMIFTALMIPCGGTFADETTPWNTYLINEVYVHPDSYYVTNTAGTWGTTCATATVYLSISRASPNARELLSLLLAAKASGRKISAIGTCGAGPGNPFFNTNYIVMH